MSGRKASNVLVRKQHGQKGCSASGAGHSWNGAACPIGPRTSAATEIWSVDLRKCDLDPLAVLERVPQCVEEDGKIELNPLIEAVSDGVGKRLVARVLILEHALRYEPRMACRHRRGGVHERTRWIGVEQNWCDGEIAVGMLQQAVTTNHRIAPLRHHVCSQLDDIDSHANRRLALKGPAKADI